MQIGLTQQKVSYQHIEDGIHTTLEHIRNLSQESLDDPKLQDLYQQGMKFWSIESPQYDSFPTSFTLNPSLTWNFNASSPQQEVLESFFNFIVDTVNISPFNYPYFGVGFESTILAVLLEQYARLSNTSTFDQIQVLTTPNVGGDQQTIQFTPEGLSALPDRLNNVELVGPGGVVDLSTITRLQDVPYLLKCYTSFGFLAEPVQIVNETEINTVNDALVSDELWQSCMISN